MNAPAAVFSIRWLIRDTFRQAMASGLFWIMLAVSLICIVLCLSISIQGDVPLESEGEPGIEALPRAYALESTRVSASVVLDGLGQAQGVWPVPGPMYSQEFRQVTSALRHKVPLVQGEMSLAFGAVPSIPLARGRTQAVKWIQFHLAGWVADAAGLLLALIWTAGFLPSFLETGSIAVLLAKPVPRWSLLAGKFIGVLAFVAFQSAIFVFGTWLALGWRTGVWDPTYLCAIPILLIHFSVFFSFSALLATATRSTVACVFGSILFWLLCWGMNYGRHYALMTPELADLSPMFGALVEGGYWLLPKPLDFHFILTDTLGARDFFGRVLDINQLASVGGWQPAWSVVASAATGLVLLALAAWDFVRMDY